MVHTIGMTAKLTASHKNRVRAELAQAGVSGYGLLKFASRALPSIIHENEHIRAAITGRYENGAALLVATDARIVFVDKGVLYSKADEIRYEMVSGVRSTIQALFSSVNLHTRIKDYRLNYVNPKASQRFVHYIEQRRVEMSEQNGIPLSDSKVVSVIGEQELPENLFVMPNETKRFLLSHELCVLSTIDRNGYVNAAPVYYFLNDLGFIYVVSKSQTNKMHNIMHNKHIALTVVDEQGLSVAQLRGIGELETNTGAKQEAFQKIVRERMYNGKKRLPPVTDLDKGAYVIFRITITDAKYTDFNKISRK